MFLAGDNDLMTTAEYKRAWAKRHYAENKEAHASRHAEWRKANREKRNAYMRAWNAKQKVLDEKKYREKLRNHRLNHRHGITQEDYDDILARQGGHCALCNGTPAQERHGCLHVDHCHETGRVRGLLCEQHNMALGKLGDTEDALMKVLDYLRGTWS